MENMENIDNINNAEKEIYIKVSKDGPYLVFGDVKIASQEIIADENGVCFEYGEEKYFEVKTPPVSPVPLCRCGKTKNTPFCDGSHVSNGFDGTETASFEPIQNGCVVYEGPKFTLKDNEAYCALARFCDANGSVWDLVYKDDEKSAEDLKREVKLCPSGRLMLFDKDGNNLEEELEKSISVLEDGGLKISGPIWVKGGIRVESEDGKSYEVRNRQTLCRCGHSKNKPFCDCTHKHIKFKI